MATPEPPTRRRSRPFRFVAIVAAGALVLAAVLLVLFSRHEPRDGRMPSGTALAAATRGVRPALADLQPLGDNRAAGSLRFVVSGPEAGVAVRYRMRNLPPGRHRARIHELGDCSAPDGSSTGAPAAEVGEVAAGIWGRSEGELHNPRLSVGELLGRSVVIEVGSGTGEGVGSGRLIACGVIRSR